MDHNTTDVKPGDRAAENARAFFIPGWGWELLKFLCELAGLIALLKQ